MKFTAPKTKEEANEYLKLRIGVTWEEHERMAKTLADIKMMLIQDRLWHTDEDQFLRRMVYESQANRKLDWKKLLFVSGVGGICLGKHLDNTRANLWGYFDKRTFVMVIVQRRERG